MKGLSSSLDPWRTLHQVTRLCWAWLVLSPDGHGASDSCSNYGYGIIAELAEGHIQSLGLFSTNEQKWDLRTGPIPARLMHVDEV